MTVVPLATVKTYFETNDRPSQSNFEDLIDSCAAAVNVIGTVSGGQGGTGVANTGKTITIGGNLTLSGAFSTTIAVTSATSITVPVSGVVATRNNVETLTNKTLTSPTINQGTVASAAVANPTFSGVVSGGGASFYAYRGTSVQVIANNTEEKVQLNTEVFDTNNNFDPVTNYRYTPTRPGYYSFTGGVSFSTPVDNTAYRVSIYKNGTQLTTDDGAFRGTVPQSVQTTGVTNMNGSSDYIELFCYQNTGSAQSIPADPSRVFFVGYRIIV